MDLFDVLVGINLLREGLDIPEVGLVAILMQIRKDSYVLKPPLIQTIGRAARNAEGRVIMYADKETDSIRKAISETNRRRKIQHEYNIRHGITPTTIKKKVRDLISISKKVEHNVKDMEKDLESMSKQELNKLVKRYY